jgi:hypothetical protein
MAKKQRRKERPRMSATRHRPNVERLQAFARRLERRYTKARQRKKE